jgi:hypothetical protein
MIPVAGKGDTYRKVKWQHFGNNYDRIFGSQDGTESKKERSREPERKQYIESYKPIEWKATYFQEGRLRYAEYSVQYHAPTENH